MSIKTFEEWNPIDLLDSIGDYVVVFRPNPDSKSQREIFRDKYRSEVIKDVVKRHPECKIQSIRKV
jgi:hypothetical protein